MYELFVLACLMSNPNHCITLKDLHGPYSTHDKCLARAYEVAQDMPVIAPTYYPKSYKCLDTNEQGKTKIKWKHN